jgi:hypothetical protein
MDALFTGLMRDARFLRDTKAPDRAWATWERLVRSRMVDPDAPALQPLAPTARKPATR